MLDTVYNDIIEGNAPAVAEGVRQALEVGNSPEEILNQTLIAAMEKVGFLFESQEFFVPEMLVSARAMQAGLAVLKPLLAETGVKPVGRVIIGTVKGDLHDIGKNLVSMMLQGNGFEVIDLGVDVPPGQFVEAVREHQPLLLGMSALLTTTMPGMSVTVKALEEAGLRDKVKVMVGGAPVTQRFADTIGADLFAPDAALAANKAKALCAEKG